VFESWGRVVYARRRLVLILAAIVVVAAAVWGTRVFGALQSAGGFSAPGSQSQQESGLAARAFGRAPGGKSRSGHAFHTGGQRQPDAEGCPLTRLGVDDDLSAVGGH